MQSGPNAGVPIEHNTVAVDAAIKVHITGVRSGPPRRPSPVLGRSCSITCCVTCAHKCIIA